MILVSPWRHHTTPSLWEQLIISGSYIVPYQPSELFAFTYCSLLMPVICRHSEELTPVRVLETLPIDILRRTRGLPNEVLYLKPGLICNYAYGLSSMLNNHYLYDSFVPCRNGEAITSLLCVNWRSQTMIICHDCFIR